MNIPPFQERSYLHCLSSGGQHYRIRPPSLYNLKIGWWSRYKIDDFSDTAQLNTKLRHHQLKRKVKLMRQQVSQIKNKKIRKYISALIKLIHLIILICSCVDNQLIDIRLYFFQNNAPNQKINKLVNKT